jgi:hypothetical protein
LGFHPPGVCMTCPSRVVAGKIEQPQAMLSDDVEVGGGGAVHKSNAVMT